LKVSARTRKTGGTQRTTRATLSASKSTTTTTSNFNTHYVYIYLNAIRTKLKSQTNKGVSQGKLARKFQIFGNMQAIAKNEE